MKSTYLLLIKNYYKYNTLQRNISSDMWNDKLIGRS